MSDRSGAKLVPGSPPGYGSPPAPRSPPAQASGTLAWVGPTGRGECVEAFRFCAARALQIALRRDLQQLIDRPAENVGRMVVVRMDRRSAPSGTLEQLDQLFPRAAKTLLLGADCEGEGRTGQPWSGFEHLYWHRWNQAIPSWFAEDSPPSAPANRNAASWRTPSARPDRRHVAVIARSRSAADGLVDAVSALGHSVVWLPAMFPAHVRNVDVCLWDDSATPPASTARWRERLAASLAVAVRQRPRHAWVVGFPRIDQWTAARRAGVEALISKPFANNVLEYFIRGALGKRQEKIV